jgi:hypothetical protein
MKPLFNLSNAELKPKSPKKLPVKVKVKVDFILEQTMKAQMGSRGLSLLFL